MLLLAPKGGNVVHTTYSTVPTGAYLGVQETSQHRPVKVKVQACFLQASAQKMLVQQNQASYIIPLKDSSPHMTYTSCIQHRTELWLE